MKGIVIADCNHGAIALSKEYRKYTKRDIYVYDTYNKLTKEDIDHLNKINITNISIEFIKENRNNLIVIAPVHMPPLFDVDYTHHEFTGYLIKRFKENNNFNFPIIEVTGVKGKTTTATLINDILSNKNRLILTSRGLFYNTFKESTQLITDISITPASIIQSLNKANDNNLLDSVDYFISEVSLGITSNCDIGVLTNIVENYPIAKGTSNASDAKKSIFTSNKIICDKTAYKNYYSDQTSDNVYLVSLNDTNSNIYTTNINYDIKSTSFKVHYNDKCKKIEFNISCFALTDYYITNILYAINVALLLNIPINTIEKNIKKALPISGRGSYRYIKDKLILEDINPGLNTASITKCVSNLSKYSNDFILIIGGDYGITCEEIDESKLINYINSLNKKQDIIFAGEVGLSLYNTISNHKYIYKNTLQNAINYALSLNHTVIEVIYRNKYKYGS